jgi:PIN domain nuclease of toxin-antitoxin system
MGERLVDPLTAQAEIAYLDTDVVVWLAQGSLELISPRAAALINAASLLISSMVLVELELRHEKSRIELPTRDIERKILHTNAVQVCNLPFPSIANAALDEKWTRDPFDRLIVANAKANGFAWLISADELMRKHYPRTVW